MARIGNIFRRIQDAKGAIMAVSKFILTRDKHISMGEAEEAEIMGIGIAVHCFKVCAGQRKEKGRRKKQ